MKHFNCLIVGAGHSGAQAALALRQNGFAGTIALVGDEAQPPYERPPLSKDYLASDRPFERLLIRPRGFWAERDIYLILETRIVAVDPAQRHVRTVKGEEIAYDTLVWATGGAPRRIACVGHDLAGVHSVRSHADVDRMIAELPATAASSSSAAGSSDWRRRRC